MSSGPAPAGPTPPETDVCPVCREPLRPTSPAASASVVVDVATRSCPYDCALTVCAEEWERAVLALARERRTK